MANLRLPQLLVLYVLLLSIPAVSEMISKVLPNKPFIMNNTNIVVGLVKGILAAFYFILQEIVNLLQYYMYSKNNLIAIYILIGFFVFFSHVIYSKLLNLLILTGFIISKQFVKTPNALLIGAVAGMIYRLVL